MFDGEIVEKKFPFKKILNLKNFQSKTESRVQDKVGLGKFLPKFFFFAKM